jgi:hypothetical protein
MNCKISGLYAGEAIAGGDACYIKASDGKVYKATGAAADEKARVAGFAAMAASAGDAVTLYHSVMFAYGPNVSGTKSSPGAPLYLSGTTAGNVADAASTGGTAPIAHVVGTDGRIFVRGNYT